jgi:hypothetical protein
METKIFTGTYESANASFETWYEENKENVFITEKDFSLDGDSLTIKISYELKT